MKYSGLSKNGDVYQTVGFNETSAGTLPSGIYRLEMNELTGALVLISMKTNYDKLLNLPDAAYNRVIKEVEHFLLDGTKARFKELDYIYKRNTLLHGVPGTGKTCIVNRVAEHVRAKNGIVLFNPHPKLLAMAFEFFDERQPDTLVMVIFEELDELIRQMGEKDFLNMLDGETQKDNVIFVATTNYIHKINPRIYRPGRFASVIEVGFPSTEARKFYLESKLPGREGLDRWARKTEGLSIDELKETVLAVECLNQPLDEVIDKLLKLKKHIMKMNEFEDDEDANEELYTLSDEAAYRLELAQGGDSHAKKPRRRR